MKTASASVSASASASVSSTSSSFATTMSLCTQLLLFQSRLRAVKVRHGLKYDEPCVLDIAWKKMILKDIEREMALANRQRFSQGVWALTDDRSDDASTKHDRTGQRGVWALTDKDGTVITKTSRRAYYNDAPLQRPRDRIRSRERRAARSRSRRRY